MRCVILTDSNAKGVTPSSIMNFIPEEERRKIDISIVVPYTLEEAYIRVGNGDVDVDGAVVVIDLLTNDIRGTWRRQGASPEELVWRLEKLRRRLREAGAVDTIICQAEPMEVVDGTPHSSLVHEYLQAQIAQGGLDTDAAHRCN